MTHKATDGERGPMGQPGAGTERDTGTAETDASVDGGDLAPADPSGLSFADAPRLELDELLQQLRDRADDVLATQGRLRGLLRANAAVVGELSLPVVLRRVVEAARELLGARYAALGVIGHDGAALEEFVHSGMDDQVVAEIGALPRGHGILGLLIRHPAPIRLPDLAAHEASAGFPPGHPPMTTFLGVPIQVGGQVFGNLYLTERVGGGEFTVEDEQLATSLAATAGAAIANARLFTESEQRRRWLVAAGELTTRLLSPGAEPPMELITVTASTAADADFATLLMPNGADELQVIAASGAMAEEMLGRTAPKARSLSAQVIETNVPQLIADLRDVDVATDLSHEVGPLILVPIAAGAQVSGVLALGRLAGRPTFTEGELSMAASFATQAAVALELADARGDQLQLAQLEDHDRIARDLHDHAIQEVFAVGLGLQALLPMVEKPAVVRRITNAIESLDRVINQIRTTIFQLNLGPQYGTLQGRLLAIAGEYTAQLGFAPEVNLVGSLDSDAAEALSEDILAVAREALSNAARHAQASQIQVVLTLDGRRVTLIVTDDGRGIGEPTRSSGLANIRHRAERHDGAVTFSTPPGGGTRVEWTALATSG